MEPAWKIRKERIYLRDERRWSAHLAWSLYYTGKRVARYKTWKACTEHAKVAHERFGL